MKKFLHLIKLTMWSLVIGIAVSCQVVHAANQADKQKNKTAWIRRGKGVAINANTSQEWNVFSEVWFDDGRGDHGLIHHPDDFPSDGVKEVTGSELDLGIQYEAGADYGKAIIDQRFFRWRLEVNAEADLGYAVQDYLYPPESRVRIRTTINGQPNLNNDLVLDGHLDQPGTSISIPIPKLKGVAINFNLQKDKTDEFHYNMNLSNEDQDDITHCPDASEPLKFKIQIYARAYTARGISSTPKAKAEFGYWTIPPKWKNDPAPYVWKGPTDTLKCP